MVVEMLGRAPAAIVGGGTNNLFRNNALRRQYSSSGGEFSCEGEHDLASMVRDYLEIGSVGAEGSWCSSDSDSGYSDLASLADQISLHKQSVDQFESDLAIVVKSLILSISERNLIGRPDACNTSCILYILVKLLQSSGYDAALCTTKWQSFGKVPGGEHEFIDVMAHKSSGGSERYIIEVDFRSHFQIARAVKPYCALLSSLPPIYVGTMTKLTQLLRLMVEAATFSLAQSSMPLPPWRFLAYLEAKWGSPCQRMVNLHAGASYSSHQQCIGRLRRLKSFATSDVKVHTKADFLIPAFPPPFTPLVPLIGNLSHPL